MMITCKESIVAFSRTYVREIMDAEEHLDSMIRRAIEKCDMAVYVEIKNNTDESIYRHIARKNGYICMLTDPAAKISITNGPVYLKISGWI